MMTNEKTKGPLPVVGWREKVSLPDWGIQGIRAKVDTGARTSAIHVANLEWLDENTVRFEVVLSEKPVRRTQWVEAKPVRHSSVKPSSGVRQKRVVCATQFQMGDQVFDAEVSLVCRKGMLCRMLVGRTAIAGRFVVDPALKYQLGRGAKRQKKQEQV